MCAYATSNVTGPTLRLACGTLVNPQPDYTKFFFVVFIMWVHTFDFAVLILVIHVSPREIPAHTLRHEDSVTFRETRNRWFIRIKKCYKGRLHLCMPSVTVNAGANGGRLCHCAKARVATNAAA